MAQLDGKVAVITGGGRGQGRAHALRLAREGADIVTCDITEQVGSVPFDTGRPGDLDETVAQVEKLGRRCVALEGDVRRTLEAGIGPVDGVVLDPPRSGAPTRR